MNSYMNSLAFLGLGMNELLVILLIAILIFGAAKIPEIARALGKSMHEFKKGSSDHTDEADKKDKVEPEDKPKI